MENNNLISKYHNADLQSRLYMYMDIPALREIFLEIDSDRKITGASDFLSGNKISTFFLKAHQFITGIFS
jgi:hypothetical protein